ncbi:MAG: hypothetical protein HZA51_16810 [Planctomycetes bacterium]|nr:hypothetical protein [Planctomycetota bacterium]
MAMERVEQLLRRVADALDAASIQYAIVGGNAVAAWVATKDPDAVRATKDVDILLDRGELFKATRALLSIDMIHAEVLGVTMFVDRKDPSPKRGVHVVIAGERIRAHYSHAAPSPASAIRSKSGFLVIDLVSLVTMKLQSFRDVDRTHIRDMLGVELITEDVRRALPTDMLARLHQIEATPEDTH